MAFIILLTEYGDEELTFNSTRFPTSWKTKELSGDLKKPGGVTM